MFSANALRRATLQKAMQNSRAASSKAVSSTSSKGVVKSSISRGWYNTFGKSTATYASWMILLIFAGEYLSGKATEMLWQANNQGHTFMSTDWSKFDAFEDDEDEDEEEEEEEDDDE